MRARNNLQVRIVYYDDGDVNKMIIIITYASFVSSVSYWRLPVKTTKSEPIAPNEKCDYVDTPIICSSCKAFMHKGTVAIHALSRLPVWNVV